MAEDISEVFNTIVTYYDTMSHESLMNDLILLTNDHTFQEGDPLIRKVSSGVDEIVRRLAKSMATADPTFHPDVVPAGSVANHTRTSHYPDEFDFILRLNVDPRNLSVTFKENGQVDDVNMDCLSVENPSQWTKLSSGKEQRDIEVDPVKIHERFGELLTAALGEVKLPENFHHGGHWQPVCSGWRKHGPALMLQLIYSDGTHHIPITVDLTVGMKYEILEPDMELPRTSFCRTCPSGTPVRQQCMLGCHAYLVPNVPGATTRWKCSAPEFENDLINQFRGGMMQKLIRSLKLIKHGYLVSPPLDVKFQSVPAKSLQRFNINDHNHPQGVTLEYTEEYSPLSSHSIKSLAFYVYSSMLPVSNDERVAEMFPSVLRACVDLVAQMHPLDWLSGKGVLDIRRTVRYLALQIKNIKTHDVVGLTQANSKDPTATLGMSWAQCVEALEARRQVIKCYKEEQLSETGSEIISTVLNYGGVDTQQLTYTVQEPLVYIRQHEDKVVVHILRPHACQWDKHDLSKPGIYFAQWLPEWNRVFIKADEVYALHLDDMSCVPLPFGGHHVFTSNHDVIYAFYLGKEDLTYQTFSRWSKEWGIEIVVDMGDGWLIEDFAGAFCVDRNVYVMVTLTHRDETHKCFPRQFHILEVDTVLNKMSVMLNLNDGKICNDQGIAGFYVQKASPAVVIEGRAYFVGWERTSKMDWQPQRYKSSATNKQHQHNKLRSAVVSTMHGQLYEYDTNAKVLAQLSASKQVKDGYAYLSPLLKFRDSLLYVDGTGNVFEYSPSQRKHWTRPTEPQELRAQMHAEPLGGSIRNDKLCSSPGWRFWEPSLCSQEQ